MKYKMVKKILKALLILCISTMVLYGCGENPQKEIELSDAQNIAELATIEAYYHNVAKINKDGSGWLDKGYKKMWIECSGIVKMGIDVNELTISSPDSNGIVTINIPDAKILGDPDIIEDTVSEPLVETGWFTDIEPEEKKKAVSDAQEEMLELAEADKAMKKYAEERAKILLEEYVKNVGDALGETYSVEIVKN